MSASVETLAYNRINGKPWHGLGVAVDGAMTSEDALHLAGLDWEVKQAPVYAKIGDEMVETQEIMNYRDTDNQLLGLVRGQYNIVQNKEAFAFTDELIGSGNVKYETAGSLKDGRVVFLNACLDPVDILGDEHIPYLLFANSHDGSSAVRVVTSFVRTVCLNTLNLALKEAKRSWSFVHKGRIYSHLEEAKKTLQLANSYHKAFAENAEQLAKKKISNAKMHTILNNLFDIDKYEKEGASKRQLANLEIQRDRFLGCLAMPDIANFKNTGWGLVNAVSDFVYHSEPLRKTKTFKENRMLSVLNGNNLLDKAYGLALAA